jgi:hypothetical protein
MTLRVASLGQGGPPDDGACDVQSGGTIELYFYGELTPAERDIVERHLVRCGVCRQSLEELAQIRAALATRPVVDAPPAGDWSAFMSRLEASIEASDPVSAVTFGSRPRLTRRYAAYLAMAALLALVTISVIVAARTRGVPPVTEIVDITPPPVTGGNNETAALTAISEHHFERSKLVVLGLVSKDPAQASGADWAYERKLASTLLNDTRLYRMAAEEHGMTAVAGVMGDLEVVLLQASLSDETDAATLAQIQRLIRKRDLLEKMNVVTTRGL